MEYHIDESHNRYNIVKVSGDVDKVGLFEAISDHLKRSNFKYKHAIYDFTGAYPAISVSGLREIIGILDHYKPQSMNFANRCAILVLGQIHKDMVEYFIKISEALPFEFASFDNIMGAKAFLEST